LVAAAPARAEPAHGPLQIAQRGGDEAAAQSLFYRGFEALRENRLEEATGLFEQGLRHSPDNPVALYYLAFAYDRMGRFDRAQPLYERAAALAPGTSEGIAARDRLRSVAMAAPGNVGGGTVRHEDLSPREVLKNSPAYQER